MPSRLIQISPWVHKKALSKLIISQHSSFALCNAAITTHIRVDIKHSKICIRYVAFWDASNVHILINSATTPGPTIFPYKHIFKRDLKGNSLILCHSPKSTTIKTYKERKIWWLIQPRTRTSAMKLNWVFFWLLLWNIIYRVPICLICRGLWSRDKWLNIRIWDT